MLKSLHRAGSDKGLPAEFKEALEDRLEALERGAARIRKELEAVDRKSWLCTDKNVSFHAFKYFE